MMPAAWQNDPTGVFDQRWWDGRAWTDRVRLDGRETTSAVDAAPPEAAHTADRLRAGTAPQPYAVTMTAPMPVGAPFAPFPPPVGAEVGELPIHAARPRRAGVVDRWAWGMVAVPAVLLVALLTLTGIPIWMALVPLALVATAALVLADLRANPTLSARTSKRGMLVRGVVLPPLYLFTRQRRLGRGQAPFSMHLGLSVMALTTAFVVGAASSPVFLDHTSVEEEIAGQVLAETEASVAVSCPPLQSATAGHSFTCTVLDEDGATNILVHMVDDQTLRWEVMGR